MNFGEKLRLLRKEKGLSQKDVAEKLNIKDLARVEFHPIGN